MDGGKLRGASSQKGRRRGNRGSVRPQAPPPMYPQYPQSGYYPQPPPPMHQQYPQSFNYPQPPPPMNPSQYNISMTSDFNPFGDYREGPSRREPSVERELPIYGEDDDDVEIVPETQKQTQIGIYFIFIRYNFLVIFSYTLYFFIYVIFFLYVIIFFIYIIIFFYIRYNFFFR
jgi:hypothetical protein